MEKQLPFENHRGETLAGTLHLPEHSSGRGVVLAHCFTCSRHTTILRRIAAELALSGCIALRFDFSGNGQSEGVFSDSTYSKQIAEMKAAADILVQEGASWVGAIGHSMGAVISVLTAAQSASVRAVCALAGRLSGMDAKRFLNPGQLQELRSSGAVSFSSRGRALTLGDHFFSDADRYDLPGTVRSFSKPFMVVHGGRDEIVPASEAYAAKALNPQTIELLVVPEADHMFSSEEHRRTITQSVVEWLTRQGTDR